MIEEKNMNANRKDAAASESNSTSPWRIFHQLYYSKLFKVEPLLVLYLFARLFYLPLSQQYYYVRFGSDLLQNTSFPFPNASYCLNSSVIDEYAGKDKYKIVETLSNHLVLYTQLAARIPGMITILILGPLSDRFGRKWILLLSMTGALLQGIVAMIIVGFSLNPYYFILASFLSGVCGDFTGMLAGAFSYAADVSSRKWRTFRIGLLEGMLGIGGGLGQFFSGYWLNQVNCNFFLLFCFTAGCCLVTLLWIIFFVPESLSREERLRRMADKPKGVSAVLQGLKMFLGRVPQYSAWKLWAAAVMLNLPFFTTEGNFLISVFFLKAPPFDINATMIGIYQSLSSAVRTISVTVVLFSFSVALGMSDGASAFVGISFQLAANVLMGFAKTEIQAFFIAVVRGVEAISWTAGRSLMSKLVSQEDQGALFSVVASIESCTSLLASVLWPLFYPMTIQNDNLPTGFIYFVMAAADLLAYPLVIPLIISEVLQRRKESNKEAKKLLTEKNPPNYSSISGHAQQKLPVYSTTGGRGSVN